MADIPNERLFKKEFGKKWEELSVKVMSTKDRHFIYESIPHDLKYPIARVQIHMSRLTRTTQPSLSSLPQKTCEEFDEHIQMQVICGCLIGVTEAPYRK